MKEQILQMVLQNMKNEDTLKIRLVATEDFKSNVAGILDKMTKQSYTVKNIRLRDKRILEVLRIKKLNRKVLQCVTPEGNFELDLRKTKNQLLEKILKTFTIRNNLFILRTKVKKMKGLIGVVINSELFIRGDQKVDDIIMNLIACKGRRESINIKGILIKCHENISFELISGLGVKVKDNKEHLIFSYGKKIFEYPVSNTDQLTKSLSFIWTYIYGYIE